MLELAILGLLQESPMHGYELRKQLTAKLGAIRAAISYGSLYPTLRRLQAAGWITEAAETPADRRGGPAADQPTRSGGLQDHRGGQGALRRAARPGRARRRTTTPASACTSRSSPAPTRRPDCASWRVAAAGSRSVAKGCATCWAGRPSASTRTPWNCSATAWTPASARSAGWRSSSPTSAPAGPDGPERRDGRRPREATARLRLESPGPERP